MNKKNHINFYAPGNRLKNMELFPINLKKLKMSDEFLCLKDFKTYQEVRNAFLQFVESLSNKLPEINQPFCQKNVSKHKKKLHNFIIVIWQLIRLIRVFIKSYEQSIKHKISTYFLEQEENRKIPQ